MLEVIFNSNGVKTTLHDSANLSVLTEESSAASKFECRVYFGDESYNNIFPEITDVTVYDTTVNEVVMEGTVHSAKPTFEQNGTSYITVTAVHHLSRLTRANVVGFEDDSGNVSTMVSRILDIYNETALPQHRITLGRCPQTGGHPEVLHIFSATCFDAITQIVVTDAKWEFRARYENGGWVLDISEDLGEFASNNIIVGVNLIDLSKTVDGTELYTRIIPIGANGYIRDGYKNPRMSTLSESESTPLTLYRYFEDPYKIYVENKNLESKYPILAKVVQYDDIQATDDTDFDDARLALYERAVADAEKLTDIIESYEVTAVDLSKAGYDFDSIELNKMYRVVNNFMGVDTFLKVTGKTTDYSNPAKCQLTFGAIGKSASRYLSKKGRTVDERINSVGATSYHATNTRLGGMSMRQLRRSAYADMTEHDNSTIYAVTDDTSDKVELYKGDTKISGDGGYTVASAAILSNATAADFIINREVMIDYSPATKVYYGSSPSFFIINGNYAYFSNILIRDDSSGKSNVIAHSEYFGGGITLRGVAYDPALTDNEYNVVDITITTRIESMQYNSTNTTSPYMEDAGIYASGQYVVPKNNRFVLMQNMAYRQNGWVEDIMLVPRIGSIFQPTDENVKALLPEGVTFVMEVILETLWKIGNTWRQNDYPPRISPYSIGWSNNNNSKFYVFFKDQAEQDFALGVTQRSEPVEVTP